MFAQTIESDWQDPSLRIIEETVLKKYCSPIASRNFVCVWQADGIERRGKTVLRAIP